MQCILQRAHCATQEGPVKNGLQLYSQEYANQLCLDKYGRGVCQDIYHYQSSCAVHVQNAAFLSDRGNGPQWMTELLLHGCCRQAKQPSYAGCTKRFACACSSIMTEIRSGQAQPQGHQSPTKRVPHASPDDHCRGDLHVLQTPQYCIMQKGQTSGTTRGTSGPRQRARSRPSRLGHRSLQTNHFTATSGTRLSGYRQEE